MFFGARRFTSFSPFLKIALVGKSNVGKSTLFNRIIQQNASIVYYKGGTTRDRRYSGVYRWRGLKVRLCDTPGLEALDQENDILSEMRKQTAIAIKESDVLFYVFDASEGVTLVDQFAAQFVREEVKQMKEAPHIILVANKAEGSATGEFHSEAYELDLGDPIIISARKNEGIGDLYDRLYLSMFPTLSSEMEGISEDDEKELYDESFGEDEDHHEEPQEIYEDESRSQDPEEDLETADSSISETDPVQADTFEDEEDLPDYLKDGVYRLTETSKLKANRQKEADKQEDLSTPIKITFFGQPNSGKSSLVNSLMEDTRCVVSSMPNTTMDPVSVLYTYKDQVIEFTDTAGLTREWARKGMSVETRIKDPGRFALKAIAMGHIACLVVDASVFERTNVPNNWEFKLARNAVNSGKPLVVAINKWDLIPEKEQGRLRGEIVERVNQATWDCKGCPVIFLSGLTGQNLPTLMNKCLMLHRQWRTRIPTGTLNAYMNAFLTKYPPPWKDGQKQSIKYVCQIQTCPPRFLFFTNTYGRIPDNFLGHVKNKLREEFLLEGIPIVVDFRSTLMPASFKKMSKQQLLKWKRLSPQAALKAQGVYKKRHSKPRSSG